MASVPDPVPLFSARESHAPLEPALAAAFSRVLQSGRFVLGEEVAAFERELAAWLEVDADRVVGVSSGSDALVVALLALDVGAGAEVVTTPFTFVATAEAIARVGARPVFADIDPATLNLDPAAARAAITERTRAVIPVHLFGHPAPMDFGSVPAPVPEPVPVIEDAAQALGARAAGKRVGTIGAAGCFSFFPTKPLGALGDGGAVVTQSGGPADRVRRLRQHGSADRRAHLELGGNWRLDALQAALLRAKLPHLAGWIDQRRALAAAYSRALADLDGVALPAAAAAAGNEPAWAHYVLRVRDGRRDALAQYLDAHAIGCAVYYRRPLHLEPAFAHLGYARGAFPHAERAADELIAIPLFPGLGADRQGRVIDAVRGFFRP